MMSNVPLVHLHMTRGPELAGGESQFGPDYRALCGGSYPLIWFADNAPMGGLVCASCAWRRDHPIARRFPAVDEQICGADADENYAPRGCLLVRGHAGAHGLSPDTATRRAVAEYMLQNEFGPDWHRDEALR